jgi:hypothetical protein
VKIKRGSLMKVELAVSVKQGRCRVRGMIRGVAFFLGAGAVSYWVWGYGSMVKVFLFLAVLSTLALLLEYLGLRANEKELRALAGAEERLTPEPAVDDDFILQPLPEEEVEWYVRRILVDGRPVRIRIGDKPGLLEKARPYATGLCEKPDELAARLKAFLGAEAQRNPLFSEEIKRLRLDSIAFMFLKQPEAAEVYFTQESGGNIFFCSMVNGEFGGFRKET